MMSNPSHARQFSGASLRTVPAANLSPDSDVVPAGGVPNGSGDGDDGEGQWAANTPKKADKGIVGEEHAGALNQTFDTRDGWSEEVPYSPGRGGGGGEGEGGAASLPGPGPPPGGEGGTSCLGFTFTKTEKLLCAAMTVLMALSVSAIALATRRDGGGDSDGGTSSSSQGGVNVAGVGDGLPDAFVHTWYAADGGRPAAPTYEEERGGTTTSSSSVKSNTVESVSGCIQWCLDEYGSIAAVFLQDADAENCRCHFEFECLTTATTAEFEEAVVFSKLDREMLDLCEAADGDASIAEDANGTTTTAATSAIVATAADSTAAATTVATAAPNATTASASAEISTTEIATTNTTTSTTTTTEIVPTLSPTPNPTKAPSTDRCDSTLCAWSSAEGLSTVAGENFGDFSGTSVSLSDDGLTLAVGEIGYMNERGRVRIFARTDTPSDDAGDMGGGGMRHLDSTQWTPLGGLSIDDDADGIPGQAAAEHFGISVALSADGRTVAAGGDGASWGYGTVRVYSYDGTKWVPRGGRNAIVGGGADDNMGKYVDLSHDGNTLAVAAPGNGVGGYGRVYKWNGTEYDERMEVFPTGPIRSLALAAKHDTLAVGSSEGNFAEVYHYVQSSSQWLPRGLRIEGATGSSDFGATVALSSDGHKLAVGAPNDESAGTKSGSATLYHWHGGAWTMVDDPIGGSPNDHAGDALALSNDGTTLAVGSPGPKEAVSRIRTYHIAPSASVTGGSISPFEWKEEGSMTGMPAALGSANRPFLSVALSGDGKFMAAGHANANVNGATSFYEEVVVPTAKPTLAPTMNPTDTPTSEPTMNPTSEPTMNPTGTPTPKPTKAPTDDATPVTFPPTLAPTDSPTLAPTPNPTDSPTLAPTPNPTASPTTAPTNGPTVSFAPTPDPCSGGGCAWTPLPGASWNGDVDEGKFGTSTALSADGSTLIVGARGSQSPGYVKAYRRDAATGAWSALGRKLAGSAPFDRFGISVDISDDGNRIAIGADGVDEGGMNTGVVAVYELRGNDFVKIGEMVGGTAYDQAGWTVAMSGDGNVVAYGASEKYTRASKWEDDNWVDMGNRINFSTRSGRTLALSYDGTTMAVGDVADAGVRVYELNGNNWSTKGTSNILRGPGDSGTGNAVALSSDGNTVAFGGPLFGFNKGMVRSYYYDGSAWTRIGTDDLVGSGMWDDSHFGTALALNEDGTVLAVGTPGVNGDDADNNGGNGDDGPWTVTTYERPAPGTASGWTAVVGGEIEGDVYAYGVERSEPNLSLALNGRGKTLAVGSALNGEAGSDRGKVTVYRYG